MVSLNIRVLDYWCAARTGIAWRFDTATYNVSRIFLQFRLN